MGGLKTWWCIRWLLLPIWSNPRRHHRSVWLLIQHKRSFQQTVVSGLSTVEHLFEGQTEDINVIVFHVVAWSWWCHWCYSSINGSWRSARFYQCHLQQFCNSFCFDWLMLNDLSTPWKCMFDQPLHSSKVLVNRSDDQHETGDASMLSTPLIASTKSKLVNERKVILKRKAEEKQKLSDQKQSTCTWCAFDLETFVTKYMYCLPFLVLPFSFYFGFRWWA